ncbi:MAG: MFS transporter, partial [Betaproteobacteria bacterium]
LDRALWALLAFRVLRSIAAGLITIAFPYLVLRDAGLSTLTLGFLYTIAAIATAVLGLLTGILADVWGRRSTLLLVGLTLPLSAALVYAGRGTTLLFAAAAVGGYSATGSLMGGGVGGAAQPIQTAIIASLVPSSRRTRYFAVFTFVSGLAAALGALAARLVSTRDAFLLAAAISGISVLFVAPFRVPEVKGDIRRLDSLRVIGQFSLTGLLNGFTQGLITPFLIPFFLLVYGVSKDRMATYGFLAGAIASFALLAAPLLDRKLGFVRAIVFTRGAGAVLVAALPIVRGLKLALGIYLVIPALRVVALPGQQRALTDMIGADETGRALGVNQVTRLAASSGAVSLTGLLFSEGDFVAPFLLYAAIMGANLYLYTRFFGRSEAQFAAGRSRD